MADCGSYFVTALNRTKTIERKEMKNEKKKKMKNENTKL